MEFYQVSENTLTKGPSGFWECDVYFTENNELRIQTFKFTACPTIEQVQEVAVDFAARMNQQE